MRIRILAEGHRWHIVHETFEGAPDRLCLSLVSEYGTVEFVPKDLRTLGILESIEREYNKLKESGPIVVESEVRNG